MEWQAEVSTCKVISLIFLSPKYYFEKKMVTITSLILYHPLISQVKRKKMFYM